MQPTGSDHQNTLLSVSISNATPGGVHPWQVRRGQCGADEGAFSSGAGYHALKIGDDGRGEAGKTVPGIMPNAGEFFVTVSPRRRTRKWSLPAGTSLRQQNRWARALNDESVRSPPCIARAGR